MRRAPLMLLAVGACARPAPEAAVQSGAEPAEDRAIQAAAGPGSEPSIGPLVEATPRTEGIVAGPRNIVEHPAVVEDPELPGRGPLVVYMVESRREMMVPFRSCIDGVAVEQGVRPARVGVRIGADGTVLLASLRGTSGNVDLDRCAVTAVQSSRLAPPPAELLEPDGGLEIPDIAFVPPEP